MKSPEKRENKNTEIKDYVAPVCRVLQSSSFSRTAEEEGEKNLFRSDCFYSSL